ncbi:unnamed protein product [Auanema sp. JU1783]|nr:unnamed protein product [Auanema sp. JU1783]
MTLRLSVIPFLTRRHFSVKAPSQELLKVLEHWKGGNVSITGEGPVNRLVLDRPDKFNCISGEMALQLGKAVKDLPNFLPQSSIVVVEGVGKSFCSGADLGMIDELSSSEMGSHLYEYMSSVLTGLRESPQIVIGKLHGHCLGGGTEIANACDIRIAHKDSKIGFIYSKIGITPSWGGATWIADIVGRSTALKLMAKAEIINAQEAKRIGYVDEVYENEEEAEEIIKAYVHQYPYVTRAQKAMLSAVKQGFSEEDKVIRSVWGNECQKKVFESLKKKQNK